MSILTGLGGSMFTMFMVVSIIVLVGIIIGGLLYMLKLNKQFNSYAVTIKELEDGNLIGSVEKAGIYKDPLNRSVTFKLKSSKINMNPNNLTYIPMENGGKLVFLGNAGVRNKVYLQPKLLNTMKAMFTRKPVILEESETDLGIIKPNLVGMKNLSLTVTEEDLEWAKREFVRHTKTFSGMSWADIMPYLLWALVVIGTIILFGLLLQKFEVLEKIANTMLEIAKANANQGTIIQ